MTRMKASPKTTARRLTSLKSFASWAGLGKVLEDYIAPTPSQTIPHPLPEGVDGLRRMCEQARNHEQRALVALGGFVGCRISEALSVTTESFDIESLMLTIRGKGDKTRVVPLSQEAWEAIAPAYVMALGKDDRHLISYKDRFARQIVTNLAVKAKLKRHVVSHDLRATFATTALDRIGNIRVVQELLGHASVDTTQIYTGVAMADMRKAVEF
jgi:site-specific recombinase XerD